MPCKKVEYKHQLSYAELSEMNIEKYAILSHDQRKALQVDGVLDASLIVFLIDE